MYAYYVVYNVCTFLIMSVHVNWKVVVASRLELCNKKKIYLYGSIVGWVNPLHSILS